MADERRETSLERLAHACAERGRPLDTTERLRLGVVLEAMGGAEIEALVHALAAVLVRSEADERLRDTIRLWLDDEVRRLRPEQPVIEAPAEPPMVSAIEAESEPERPSSGVPIGLIAAGAFVVVLVGAFVIAVAMGRGPTIGGGGGADGGNADAGAGVTTVATTTITTSGDGGGIDLSAGSTTAYIVSGLALITALLGALWLPRVGARRERPDAYGRAFFRDPIGANEQLLLSALDESELTTGLARHTRSLPSAMLDGTRTAHATAQAAGMAKLVWGRRKLFDGAWLWNDRTRQHPEKARFADELERAATRSGIELRLGDFVETPEVLALADGPRRLADLMDECSRARVLMLTDGAGMMMAADRDPLGRRLTPLLQQLAELRWLTVIDFGADDRFARLLAQYRIRHLPASEAARAFADEIRPSRAASIPADLQLWSDLVALCPGPVADVVALRLRRDANLDVPSWWLSSLRARGALRGKEPERRVHLRRLLGAFGLDRQPLALRADCAPAAPAKLAAALRSLSSAHDEFERAHRHEPNWQVEGAKVQLSKALIDLWTRPGEAIEALHRLARAGLGVDVGASLSMMQPWTSRPHADALLLPWSESSLSRARRRQLAALGLGSGLSNELPARRRSLLLAAAFTTAIVAFAFGVIRDCSNGPESARAQAPDVVEPDGSPAGELDGGDAHP